MPRNNGVYSLPNGYIAVSGEKIRPSQHNPPLEDLADAMTNSLPRDGSAPMTGDLAMGGRKATNLAAGTAASDAVRFDQITPIVDAVDDLQADVTTLQADVTALELDVTALDDRVNWEILVIYDSASDPDTTAVEATLADGYEYEIIGDAVGTTGTSDMTVHLNMSGAAGFGLADTLTFTPNGTNVRSFYIDLKQARISLKGRALVYYQGDQSNPATSSIGNSTSTNQKLFWTDAASPEKIDAIRVQTTSSQSFNKGRILLRRRKAVL